MPKVTLTDRFCKNVKLSIVQIDYSDTRTAGLSLRVSKNTRRSYFYKKVSGKVIRRALKAQGLPEARLEVAVLVKGLLLSSSNTLPVKRNNKLTFLQLCEKYIELKRGGGSRGDFWALGASKMVHACFVSDITKQTVEGLYNIKVIENSVGTANRVLSFVNAVLRWGYENDLFDNLRAVTVKKKGAESRNRVLSVEEFQRFYIEVEGLRSAESSTILKLLMLTGLRLGEILSLRHTPLYIDHILLKKTKMIVNRNAPISPATALLLTEWSNGLNTGDKLFSIKSVRRPFLTACKRAGLADFRIHDIRRTAATLQVESGAQIQTAAANLGHGKSASVIDTYVRSRPHAQIEALTELSNIIINK